MLYYFEEKYEGNTHFTIAQNGKENIPHRWGQPKQGRVAITKGGNTIFTYYLNFSLGYSNQLLTHSPTHTHTLTQNTDLDKYHVLTE